MGSGTPGANREARLRGRSLAYSDFLEALPSLTRKSDLRLFRVGSVENDGPADGLRQAVLDDVDGMSLPGSLEWILSHHASRELTQPRHVASELGRSRVAHQLGLGCRDLVEQRLPQRIRLGAAGQEMMSGGATAAPGGERHGLEAGDARQQARNLGPAARAQSGRAARVDGDPQRPRRTRQFAVCTESGPELRPCDSLLGKAPAA